MDPLSAFSLATNIISIIGFLTKLTSTAGKIRRSTAGATTENESLNRYVDSVKTDAEKILQTLAHAASNEETSDFENLVQSCISTCNELKAVLGKMAADGRKWSVLRATVNNSLHAQKKIELVKDLERYPKLFDSYMTNRLR
jgi:hypothetical protein